MLSKHVPRRQTFPEYALNPGWGAELLAHAPIYNAILDRYVESLELGKNGSAFVQGKVSAKMEDHGLFTLPYRLGDSKPFDTLADLGSCVNIIPLYLFKKLNIGLLEETGHIFGLVDGTKSYPKDPETPLLVGRGFLAIANAVIDCRMAKIAVGEGITRSMEIARDAEINPFKDLLVFRRMVEFLGAIPINLKSNMWESEDLINNPINWNKPPKNRDGAWHAKIRLIDPDGEELNWRRNGQEYNSAPKSLDKFCSVPGDGIAIPSDDVISYKRRCQDFLDGVLGLDGKQLKLLLLTLQVDNNNSPIFVCYLNLQRNLGIRTVVEYQKALLASLDMSALDKLHFQLENLLRRFIHESNPDDVGSDDRVTTSSNTVILITTCSCPIEIYKYMMKAQVHVAKVFRNTDTQRSFLRTPRLSRQRLSRRLSYTYKHAHTQKDVIEAMVKELLEARVIKPSHTPFASRVVMVKKKDNSWRMYVDYRQLNKNAIKDKFHISIIEELIDELSGVVVFLKLDLSKCLDDHSHHLTEIPTIMRRHSLFAKRSKFVFGTTHLEYLRHVISVEGVATDSAKIKAMEKWPQPKNIKQITTLKQMKWLPKLMGFDCEVVYKKGIDNRVVDALSRLENQSELFSLTTSTISTNLFKRVMDSWSDDEQLKEIIDGLQFGTFEKKHYTWVNGKLLRKKTGGW
ncbi:hypothetical protein Tco_1291937 [Tanacetum coccineum]